MRSRQSTIIGFSGDKVDFNGSLYIILYTYVDSNYPDIIIANCISVSCANDVIKLYITFDEALHYSDLTWKKFPPRKQHTIDKIFNKKK